jgi:hypothetical protein
MFFVLPIISIRPLFDLPTEPGMNKHRIWPNVEFDPTSKY